MADLFPKTDGWVMTKEAFDSLLSWLHPDREQAGRIYENIRVRLMKFFECQGCPAFEEYTDDTIHRVIQKIDEGEKVRSGDPYVYFHGVARNVLREYWKSRERKFEPLDSLPASDHPTNNLSELEQQERDRMELEKSLECLDRCLRSLPSESRELFIEYNKGQQRTRINNRNLLANRLGIPINALRIRIHRIRDRLERCVLDCVERSVRKDLSHKGHRGSA